MLETCNSCGTVFDIDENILSKKIRWLRCSVCNEKWSVSSIVNKIYEVVLLILLCFFTITAKPRALFTFLFLLQLFF